MRRSRRDFIAGTAAVAAGVTIPLLAPTARAQQSIEWATGGTDLQDWKVVHGDSRYPNDPSLVNKTDIETLHYGQFSELRANIHYRPIMAHNITYKQIDHRAARAFTHTGRYEFRLPFIPSKTGTQENAQTFEGMLVVWDGSGTRLDYGLGFQWRLNPWVDDFGTIWTWSANGDRGRWDYSGALPVDSRWHVLNMVVDHRQHAASLDIDGRSYPVRYATINREGLGWGTETAARLQAEIVSCYPEPSGLRALHHAEVRNWSWTWRWP